MSLFGHHTVVGVDIGSRYIKAVQLSSLPWQGVTAKIGIADNPRYSTGTVQPADYAELAEAIREAMAVANIKAEEAVTAVSGHEVLLRRARFPQMSREELAEAIKWEVERYFPFALTELFYDWNVVAEDRTGQEIILVAAKRQTVNNYIDVFNAAKLDLLAIDAEPFAVLRTLGQTEEITAAGTIMVADIGVQGTKIIIACDGLPLFLQVLPFDAAAQAASNSGQELSRQLQRSLDYYKAQNHGKTVERILLCGGGANLMGITEEYTAYLQVPVTLINPLRDLNLATDQGENDRKLMIPSLYVTGVGLALWEEDETA